MDKFHDRRREMVEHQIRARGVHAPGVLEAMGHVSREAFPRMT